MFCGVCGTLSCLLRRLFDLWCGVVRNWNKTLPLQCCVLFCLFPLLVSVIQEFECYVVEKMETVVL